MKRYWWSLWAWVFETYYNAKWSQSYQPSVLTDVVIRDRIEAIRKKGDREQC